MASKRNYKAEYARRVANAEKRGLSRSQGRGHARHNEAPIKPSKFDERLEAALRALHRTGNRAEAARSVKIAPERLCRFLRENVQIEGRGRSFKIIDNRSREMLVLSEGTASQRLLRGYDQASLNGKYLSAVKSFLNSNIIEYLRSFEGQSVVDAKGKTYPLETDPNQIYRLASGANENFTDIYRLVL
jgi:hypothetical protein